MQCPKCGSRLETGKLFCEKCGREIQMVPDYDPLDELIIGRETVQPKQQKKQKLTEKEHKLEDGLNCRFKKRKRRISRRTRTLLLLACAILLCFGVFLTAYYTISRGNNYSYQLKKGISLTEKGEYEAALPFLRRAQSLQAGMEGADMRPLRYLARAYAGTGDGELAADCMKSAVRAEEAARGDTAELQELYLDFMELLNETRQTELIGDLIDNCRYADIQKALQPYRIKKPSCDTPEGTYRHYTTLELSADYGVIYYTLDGTTPTAESARYGEPIKLLEEGETLLSAVAINSKGIVSEELVLVYKLKFDHKNLQENEEE